MSETKGEGGLANDDNGWQSGGLGVSQILTITDKGERRDQDPIKKKET